jgi:hypothetical protein
MDYWLYHANLELGKNTRQPVLDHCVLHLTTSTRTKAFAGIPQSTRNPKRLTFGHPGCNSRLAVVLPSSSREELHISSERMIIVVSAPSRSTRSLASSIKQCRVKQSLPL